MGDQEPPAEPDCEAYGNAYRDKISRRFSAAVAFVIAVVGVFVIVVRVLAPQDYPAGDIRNEIGFRLAFAAFFLLLIGTVLVGAVRRLRQND